VREVIRWSGPPSRFQIRESLLGVGSSYELNEERYLRRRGPMACTRRREGILAVKLTDELVEREQIHSSTLKLS